MTNQTTPNPHPADAGEVKACCPFFHRYGGWTDKVEGRGAVLIQERRCQTCNRAQRRQTLWLGYERQEQSNAR